MHKQGTCVKFEKYIIVERRGVHEVEHWTRDAQLLLVAPHKYSYVTVRREVSAPFRGHLC